MTAATRINPTPIALALSAAFGGHCVPMPSQPVRWFACPECAKYLGKKMTICRVCGGSGRLAYL